MKQIQYENYVEYQSAGEEWEWVCCMRYKIGMFLVYV